MRNKKRNRVWRVPKAAKGNARLTDFVELREVVLYHVKAVEQLPNPALKSTGIDHRLGAWNP
ncbi:MAG TPA: hypothetical protein VJK52_06190 [Candidatus Nanoarchaeia archaeon]|nr:hypothetical protein [Candidatus Nanoarchaeia archaeon]